MFTILCVVESTFNIVNIRCNQQPFSQPVLIKPGEFWQAIQREVQLGRVSTHTDVFDFVGKAGLQVTGSYQIKKCGFRVSAGDNRIGGNLFSIFQFYPGNMITIHVDAGNRR